MGCGMYLTKREAALLGGLKKALDLGRLNPKAPTFTARSVALAVASILEQNVTDREVVPLLDQMGVLQRGTGRDPYQRPMAGLLKELPKALEYAKVATDEGTGFRKGRVGITRKAAGIPRGRRRVDRSYRSFD